MCQTTTPNTQFHANISPKQPEHPDKSYFEALISEIFPTENQTHVT